MGASQNPAWYHNVAVNPRVTVEIGQERFEADAQILEGPERSSAWQRASDARPFLIEHQKMAGDRIIPLIGLRRLS